MEKSKSLLDPFLKAILAQLQLKSPFLARLSLPLFMIIKPLLYLLALIFSLLYAIAIYLRNLAFDLKLIDPFRPKAWVISVGNISAGGTGKTPLTIFLANLLCHHVSPHGKVAVLSRGYRSLAERAQEPYLLSVGDGRGPLYDAATCGDEPCLIAASAPQALVIVNSNRKKSAQLALSLGATILLLDDGFQHRYIARDLNIALIDGQNPFGNGYLLPLGSLREPKSSLKRANLIVLNHVDAAQFEPLRTQFSPLFNQAIGSFYRPSTFRDWRHQPIDFHSKAAPKIALFCGIAHPYHFQRSLENLNFQVVSSLIFADHQPIDMQALSSFALNCRQKGALALICTAKDRFRFIEEPLLCLPIYYLPIELEISANYPLLDQLLSPIISGPR